MKLLAVTLSMIVLNKFRDKEILRNFQCQSKDQCSSPIMKFFDSKETTSVKTVLQFIGLKGKQVKHSLQLLARYGAHDYPELISRKRMLSFVD